MVLAIYAPDNPLPDDESASVGARERVPVEFAKLELLACGHRLDCTVQFAPDHFNGFFDDLMPSFCIGESSDAEGDGGRQGLDRPSVLFSDPFGAVGGAAPALEFLAQH